MKKTGKTVNFIVLLIGLALIAYYFILGFAVRFGQSLQFLWLLGGLLCAIIGIVGVLNFLNAMMTAILSRRRDFAVLQAVGQTGRQLKAMLIWEGLLYTVGSALISLLLSVLINPLAGRLLESVYWFFRYRFTVSPVLLTIPVFVLLGCGIPSAMYRQTAKQSVVERLREAET